MTRLIWRALLLIPLAAACALPGRGTMALDDTAVVGSGEGVFIAVLANDRPPSGEALIITETTGATGSVKIESGGLAYGAPPGFSGVDTFTYTVRSESGSDATATVVVTVGEAGSAATAGEDDRTSTEPPPDGKGDVTPPAIEAPVLDPPIPNSAAAFAITALASDESGIGRIEVFLDGRSHGDCSESPCTSNEVGPLSVGAHEVAIEAIDAVGNRDLKRFKIDVVEALPDLVVQSFEQLGPGLAAPSEPVPTVDVPVRVVIANVGSAPASGFGFSVHDDNQRPFLLEGKVVWYPELDGLAAGETGELFADVRIVRPAGPSSLIVNVDSCAGREFAPPGCDVVELDEGNNASVAVEAELPPVASIGKPSAGFSLDMPLSSGYTINVDGTESFDPNGGALTFIWEVERDADGQLLAVGTSAAGPVSFDLLPTGCTADYRIWLTVTDPAGLRASTYVEGTGSRLC